MVVASKRKPLNRAARKQARMVARKGCGHERLKREAAMYKGLCGKQEEQIRRLIRHVVEWRSTGREPDNKGLIA